MSREQVLESCWQKCIFLLVASMLEHFYHFYGIDCIPANRFESFHSKPSAVDRRRNFSFSACRMIITVTQDDSRFYEGSYIHIYLERSCNNLSCHENNIIRSQFNVFPSSLSILNIIQNVSVDHMLRLPQYTYMHIPTI